MPRQEDLEYVQYGFEKEGYKCFKNPFDRNRPDMICVSEGKLKVIELKTGTEPSDRIVGQMIRMKKNTEELYKTLSNRPVEFLLVIPKLKRGMKEKLDKEGIEVLERILLPF